MATIGLDRLYYAPITEAEITGDETYGTPVMLAKAISAELSVELAEATLYADDGAAVIIKEFKNGTLSLGVDDIGRAAAEELTGATTDDNGVLVSSSEDGGSPVAIGFRAKKANGKYRYFWLYKVKFGVPSTNLATKGDSITFRLPPLRGRCRGATSWTATATIHGKQKSMPMIPAFLPLLFPAGTTRCTSRRSQTREVNDRGR